MFLKFFRFDEQPFGATPDPKFIFWSRSHREALASIYYGIKADRGFTALVAPPGLGKTTLLLKLIKSLEGTHQTAFLFQTCCKRTEFLRLLLADLGCEASVQDPVKLQLELNRLLADFMRQGKQLILFIDEAQNLTVPVLEMVRLLSNFERPDHKLLQVVMAGQLQLLKRLERPSMTQLRQRISMFARLEPLDEPEVHKYIEHRLSVAAYRGPALFQTEALENIAACSKGIPRVINSMCFNSLSLACARKTKKIDAAIVKEVARDMGLSIPASVPEISLSKDAAENESEAKWLQPSKIRRFQVENPSHGFELPVRNLIELKRRWYRHSLAITLLVGVLLSSIGLAYFMNGSHRSPLPIPNPPAVALPPVRKNWQAITIRPNDTLESITLKHLGQSLSPQLLKTILNMNPQLINPNRIEVGDIVNLPAAAELSETAGHNTAQKRQKGDGDQFMQVQEGSTH